MMSGEQLITLLATHADAFPEERLYCEQTLRWIEQYQDRAFVRTNLLGHLTGSLLVIDDTHMRVLLMKHKKLGMWLQFGGHADGEVNLRNVALREFQEESGIMVTPYIFPSIFDVHVHPIPARGEEPEHFHYDVVFLAKIPSDTTIAYDPDEAEDVRWFDIEGIEKYIAEERMLRMMEKIKNL